MAKHVREYTAAPTAEEIKTGYAPSTIRGTPFVKFLFWTFAGLAITYAVTWGATVGIDAVNKAEQERHARIARQRVVPFEGPRLQPSPGHETLDFVDMEVLADDYKKELIGMGWKQDERFPNRLLVSDQVVASTAAAMGRSPNWKPDTKK